MIIFLLPPTILIVQKDDEKLYPYVYKAVKSAYLLRGDEGSSSSTEGSLSTSYEDIEEN